jgi:hypothetical protein
MEFPLSDLLKIRERRENRRQELLRVAQVKLAQAKQNATEEKRRMERYTEYREKEEDRLYQALKGKSIQKQQLRDLDQQVSLLRAEQLNQQKVLDTAEASVDQVNDEVDTARREYTRAATALEKINTQKGIWLEEWKISEVRAQDNELDDVPRRVLLTEVGTELDDETD